MRPVVLASASPRRQEILARFGIGFEVRVPRESAKGEGPPEELARRRSREKLHSVRQEGDRGILVAADTVVALGEHILGKPASEQEALEMLRLLGGRWHRVITAVRLLDAARGTEEEILEVTFVKMRRLPEDWLKSYVATGEPLDKAGAYGIQGRGGLLVEQIEGDFWNVVGFPMRAVVRLLEVIR